MALSRIVYPGDGVTTQFAIPFSLGYIRESDVTCRVGDEVDGGGNPRYRQMTFISPELVSIAGTGPAPGPVAGRVVFTRTVERDGLLVDYEDGAIINEVNMNTAQKQALMLVHEVLDGRFEAFQADLDLGGFRVTNVGDPQDAGDLITLGYAEANSGNAISAANAANASATAAAGYAGQSNADRVATAADRVQTGLDKAATAADRVQTGLDRTAVTTLKGQVDTAKTAVDTQKGLVDAAKTAVDTAKGQVDTAKASVDATKLLVDAVYDSFDDRYLGSKASNPTLDNDGNALIDGAIYWNSAAKELRFWSVSSAAWIAANNVLSAVPVGMIAAFPVNTAPAGWLVANGSTFSSATYPDLATYLGSTTLPDLRGEFIRGLDNGRGIDTGRTNMSLQLDAAQGWNYGSATALGKILSAVVEDGIAAAPTASTGTARVNVGGGNAALARVSDGTNGTPRIAAETRPRNVAMVLCIKAFGGIINQGSLDAAAVAAAQLKMVRVDQVQAFSAAEQRIARVNIGIRPDVIWSGPLPAAGVQNFLNLGAYRQIHIVGNVRPAVDTLGILLQLSSDNGASFITSATYGHIGVENGPAQVSNNYTGFLMYDAGISNIRGSNVDITLFEFNEVRSTIAHQHIYHDSAAGALRYYMGGAALPTVSAMNALRFVPTAASNIEGHMEILGWRT